MASNDVESVFQCSHCKDGLDMESKSFPCLHSFCETCLNKEVKRKTNGYGHCPQCDEIGKLDKLTLSPILISCLKYRRMDSTEWKCDFCLDDQIESIATNWCENCEKFFCATCNQFHKKLPPKKHNTIELNGNGKEVKKSFRTDMCDIHNKLEDLYCKRCNVCLCDACYTHHLKDSGDCSSCAMSVREEALNKQESQIPKLLLEIHDFEKDLEERREKKRNYNEELEKQCDLKCKELWQNYEDAIMEMKEKTNKLCDELRWTTKDQVKKWQKFLLETERMLKKLEIWRLNLQHLLKKGPKKKDVVLGVELVARILESSSLESHRKIKEPLREWQLRVKYSDLWQKFLENLQKEKIGLVFWDSSGNSIEYENEWNLPRLNRCRTITSIAVCKEDDHIFLVDESNSSIIELNESGKLVCELIVGNVSGYKFTPTEMFFNSSEILGVNCWWGQDMLVFFEREKVSPFLKLKFQKIITQKNPSSPSFSVCKIEKNILISDMKFQLDLYTEKGDFIKTLDSRQRGWGHLLIRVDPSTGNLWCAERNTCKMFCLNENGEKIESVETEKIILDFSVNEFGQIYFCNQEGIFAFFPEKNLHKTLHNFQKKIQNWPKIYVSSKTIFVYLEINKKYLIQIFKFLD